MTQWRSSWSLLLTKHYSGDQSKKNELDGHTRWFKYDRDYLCVNKSQFVPVIFEPPCILGMRERRDAHRFLVRKPDRRRPIGKPRRWRKDNIKIDLKTIVRGLWLDWCGLGQGQAAGFCEISNKPPDCIKNGEFLEERELYWLLKKELVWF